MGCNSIVDRSIDVFVAVFEGDSKAVEAMALYLDVDVLVRIATGDTSYERRCNRLGVAIRRKREREGIRRRIRMGACHAFSL